VPFRRSTPGVIVSLQGCRSGQRGKNRKRPCHRAWILHCATNQETIIGNVEMPGITERIKRCSIAHFRCLSRPCTESCTESWRYFKKQEYGNMAAVLRVKRIVPRIEKNWNPFIARWSKTQDESLAGRALEALDHKYQLHGKRSTYHVNSIPLNSSSTPAPNQILEAWKADCGLSISSLTSTLAYT